MKYLQIGGLNVELSGDGVAMLSVFLRHLSKFSSNVRDSPDLCIQIVSEKELKIPQEKSLIDEYVKWIIKPDGGYIVFSIDRLSEKTLILVETDRCWKNVVVRVPTSLSGYRDEQFKNLISSNIFFILGLIFRNAILEHDGFVIHSSSIDYNGHGIIFSAPSGTGKSTHVNLWNTYYSENTRVINDDTPIIRIINNIPYLFGSPWCGSSFIGINASVELKAMVAIERGTTNVIRQLDPDEALALLMPRIFIPFYDEMLMDLTIGSFERVLSKVPSYLLSCTIDRQAVELVRTCVK